jgi:hypothetical protein
VVFEAVKPWTPILVDGIVYRRNYKGTRVARDHRPM